MRSTVIQTTFLVFFAMMAALSARAETVTDSKLGFKLTLPAEFTPRPDLVGATPDIVHAFQFGAAAEGKLAVLLLVEKMGGVIGREHLQPQNMPAGFNGQHFMTTWRG